MNYQTGWIREIPRDGWTAFKLCWREKSLEGKWIEKNKTMPRETIRKDAQKALDLILKSVNDRGGASIIVAPVLFKDLVDGQWKDYVSNRQMRPGTQDGYSAMLKNWISPFFDAFEIGKVTPAVISSFMAKLVKEGLSDKYRKNIYNLLTMVFDLAQQNDVIQVSPVRPKLHRPQVRHKEKPTLPMDQSMKLLAAVREIGGPVYAIATATLMLTGMRQGELLGLRRQDVDLTNRTLTKSHVLYRGQLLEGTKNTSNDGKVRQQTLPMSDLLFNALRTALTLCPSDEPTSFVFCNVDGSPLDPDHFRNQILYKAMDKIGIERGKGTHGLHMFRHTAGSLVFNTTTGNMKAAQEQLGHSNMQTTANIYVHTDLAQKQLSANVLAEPLTDFAAYLLPVNL